MSYSNGRITGAVSINDVQRALGLGSVDLATLCESTLINPWARYRPIPCRTYNTPSLITPAQRIAERYGVDQPIDMFTADSVTGYEIYAESIQKYGKYYIKLLPWQSNISWHRLSDFVKTDNSGALVANKGYDHKAQPDNKKVTIGTGSAAKDYYLTPLIPESQRIMSIPSGSTDARFKFPVDHIWMSTYYNYMYGTTSQTVVVSGNEEWLSPIDFMGRNTYYNPSYTPPSGRQITTYAEVVRRIIILRYEDRHHRIEGDSYYDANDAAWRFYNHATDKITSSSDRWNSTDRPFASYPEAWLDLTDSEAALNTIGERRLKDLKGKCLFIDCWVQVNSSVNVFPILGYAYEVTITRTSQNVNIDIDGVLVFDSVEAFAGDSIVIRGHISQEYVQVVEDDSNAVKDLISSSVNGRYNTLKLTINGTDYNLMNNNAHTDNLSLDGTPNMVMFEMVFTTSASTFPLTGTMSGTDRSGNNLNPKVLNISIG